MDTGDLAQGGGVAAIVIALTQVIKPLVPHKYAPLICLSLGIVIGGGLVLAQTGQWATALMQGIVIGLAAGGVYDQKALLTS